MMPVVLLLLWLVLQNGLKLDKFFVFVATLVVGITLIHTRIIIGLLIALVSFFLARRLQFKGDLSIFQTLRLSFLFVLVLWPLSRPLMNFYNTVPIWIILLLLMPFAFQTYPTAAVGTALFLFGSCVVALVPSLVDENKLMLLDRQFLEMILCVPLSMMGGLGFGGLVRKLKSNTILKWSAAFVLCGYVIFGFLQGGSVYPDECCNYFGKKDETAFQWVQNNFSDNTLFIISAFSDKGKIYGTDAGIWIYPLTGIPTNKLAFNFNWDSANALGKICTPEPSKVYIYSGGKKNSFNDLQLTRINWVKRVFQDGEVAIYKVSDCTTN